MQSRLYQFAWFIGLWLAGVATLGVVAYAIRWVIESQFPG